MKEVAEMLMNNTEQKNLFFFFSLGSAANGVKIQDEGFYRCF